MNSKELFTLFLRIVGMLGVIHIVRNALLFGPTFTASLVYFIIKWVIGVLVGLYLIRGAPLLVKFAYPEKPSGLAQ
jgi:predicted membrane protein